MWGHSPTTILMQTQLIDKGSESISTDSSSIDNAVETSKQPDTALMDVQALKFSKNSLIKSVSQLPSHWALTPIKDKKPLRKAWNTEKPISRDELKDLLSKDYWNGIGLRTGGVSGGLVAIDVDGHSALPILDRLSGGDLPKTVQFKSGKPGRYQSLYQVPESHLLILNGFTKEALIKWEELKTVVADDGKEEQLDFRYNSVQSALPPSYHPETGGYVWVNSPETTPVAEAPQWLCDLLLEFAQKGKKTAGGGTSSPSTFSSSKHPEIAEVAKALGYCPADDRYVWISFGMACHSEGDHFFGLWNDWSKKSTKYKPGECEAKWKGFSRGGAINIWKVFDIAKEYGYRYEPATSPIAVKEWMDTRHAAALGDSPSEPTDSGSFVDSDEFAAELIELRTQEAKREALIEGRVNDDEIYPESFFLKGIWSQLYGGRLWDTMLNRYPALTLSIMPYLMGTVPLNLELISPFGNASVEPPTLWTAVSGASGNGKGEIYKLLARTLGKAIGRLDAERVNLQADLSAKVKRSQSKVADENGEEPIPFNRNLLGTSPIMKIGDVTPAALKKQIAAQEAYHKLSEGSLMATGQFIRLSEAQMFINQWCLAEVRGNQAALLNGYWSNEVSTTLRATESQFYSAENAFLSIQMMLTDDQLSDVLNAEKPLCFRRCVVNGFSARLQTIEIDKNLTRHDPSIATDEESDRRRFELENECTARLERGIKQAQMILHNQIRVWMDDDAKALARETKVRFQEFRDLCQAKTWTAYCNKLDANLVRLSFAARLMRLVSDCALTPETRIELKIAVEKEDVDLAAHLLEICAKNRLKYEFDYQSEIRQDEHRRSETRSIKQNTEAVLQRFADAVALKDWVDSKRVNGLTTLKALRESLSNRERKILKANGIDYNQLFREILAG